MRHEVCKPNNFTHFPTAAVAFRSIPRLRTYRLSSQSPAADLHLRKTQHCKLATLFHGHCPFLSQPCMPLHSFCQMETQQGQVAAIIPCVQHRHVTPPAWELSKARRGTGTELLRSMRPSQGARSNTGATLHHAPCTPGLTRSLDQHHTGTGKYSCRSSGKRREAESNPESRFCTRTLAHNSHCSARHPREMYDLLDHKRISA